MPLVLKDRVRETSITSGTGTLTLNGAVAGFQSFSVIGNANTTYYAIVDVNAGSWEVGLGTYTASGTILSRDVVLESSAGGVRVNFSSSIKDVFCTYPAEQAVTLDDIQTLANKTISSPSLTGTPTAPTAAAATNTTQVATTAHVFAERTNTATLTNKTLSSPSLNNTTALGQTLFAEGSATVPSISFVNDGAPDTGLYHISDGVFGVTCNTMPVVTFKSSGAELLGTPTAPTAAAATNTTQVATTAHVFAERTNTATLTNKTLTSPVLNNPSIGTNGLTFNDGTQMGSAVSLGLRNILFNADFRVNQRVYVSGAVLAAGVYGHDRFKAGASGGDYSFTQLNSSTQVTIAAGKSLVQVVEDKNVFGGSYILSWSGTALGRVGVNTATPAGAFVVSPILITGQTIGTTMSFELNAGTVNTVQLEQGSVSTPFERRPIGLELALCQRYFERIGVDGGRFNLGYCAPSSSTNGFGNFTLSVKKRALPTVVINSPTLFRLLGSNQAASCTVSVLDASTTSVGYTITSTGLTIGAASLVQSQDSQFPSIDIAAEL